MNVKLIAVISSILFLTSCIGASLTTSEIKEIRISSLPENPKISSKYIKEKPLTLDLLISKWGEPDKIEYRTDNTEKWIYTASGNIDKSLFAMLIIVPLYVPLISENRQYIITVKEKNIIKVEKNFGKVIGGVCGVVVKHHAPEIGCTQ